MKLTNVRWFLVPWLAEVSERCMRHLWKVPWPLWAPQAAGGLLLEASIACMEEY